MTPLQQTALDFCRECLGWELAKESMWGHCSNKMVVLKRGRSVVKRLRYTDLNAVMEAVSEWSRSANVPLVCGLDEKGFWAATRGDAFHARHDSNDICLALLGACVAGNRKLKGISND